MRDYSKVSPLSWIGNTASDIRALAEIDRDHARNCLLVEHYLMSAPSATMLGIYHLPLASLAEHILTTKEGALKALRSLQDLGFCVYDERTSWVWVREMAGWQIEKILKPGDRRIAGVAKDWLALPNLPMLNDFFERWRDAFQLPPRPGQQAPNKDLLSPIQAPSKPGAGAGAGTRSGTGEEAGGEPSGGSPPPVPRGPAQVGIPMPTALFEVPLKDGSTHPIYPGMVANWETEYPHVDVRFELASLVRWNTEEKARRKTAPGIGRHINNWLGKEERRAARRNGGKPQSNGAIALAAYTEVRAAFTKGQMPARWSDPRTQPALDAIGGWAKLKHAESQKLDYLQHNFMVAFNAGAR